MATLIGCYSELQAAFEHSVDPTHRPVADRSSRRRIGAFATGPLALSAAEAKRAYARSVATICLSDGGRPYSSSPTR